MATGVATGIKRWWKPGLGALLLAAAGGCGDQAGSDSATPAGARVKILSAYDPARPASDKSAEVSPEARMIVKRGQDYVPITVPGDDSQPLFDTLEGSMAERRTAAWGIVERMLAPQKLTLKDAAGKDETYDVPLWHTWYEGATVEEPTLGGQPNVEIASLIRAFIGAVGECKKDKKCEDTLATRAELARKIVADFSGKPMAFSLRAANMTRTLNQLQSDVDDTPAGSGFSPHLGNGFTLFSPSFVEHMLSQAQGIEQCYDAGKAKKAADAPRSPTQFSHCIDEFPRSAVMVKASWSEVDPAKASVPAHDTSAAGLAKHLTTLGSAWPHDAPLAKGTPDNMYAVQADNGKYYGLNAIHFSTKDTREWIWVTLWWDPKPDLDFGADRPAAIAAFNGGVWGNYKMCVTSAFAEKDPAPWSHYESSAPTLAAAIKKSYDAMVGQKQAPPFDMVTSWCSNPNVEGHINNDKTNCIGCHQYSTTLSENKRIFGLPEGQPAANDFADTIWISRARPRVPVPADYQAQYRLLYPQLGRARMRNNFAADFAWSTHFEFIGTIGDAREDAGFTW